MQSYDTQLYANKRLINGQYSFSFISF